MTSRKYAEKAAAALGKMLQAGTDSGKVADIVESVLADATREHDEQEQHVTDVEAAAATRLACLLERRLSPGSKHQAAGQPERLTGNQIQL